MKKPLYTFKEIMNLIMVSNSFKELEKLSEVVNDDLKKYTVVQLYAIQSRFEQQSFKLQLIALNKYRNGEA